MTLAGFLPPGAQADVAHPPHCQIGPELSFLTPQNLADEVRPAQDNVPALQFDRGWG